MALHLFKPPAPIQIHRLRFTPSFRKPTHKLLICSLSKSQANTLHSPPSSREEAISQARNSLSTTLQKSIKNSVLYATKKMKKQKQPRYRIEIPVIDDSPNSIIKLASEVFSDLPIKRVDSKSTPTILLIYSSPTVLEVAEQSLSSVKSSNVVINSELSSVSADLLSSCNLAVLLSPDESQLEKIRTVTDALDPIPVILFNPKWAFEDEKDFDKGLANFLASFQVVYSFTGLEVKGILSRKRGVILKSVKDGVFNEEGWLVMVEEGQNGEMKLVTKFTQRPSIVEVETVLYNLMAVNSPVTKSVKFFKDLVSNVTRKKKD
ncbi:hypothetical protein LUZ60_001357 [Juncus effusus]|nr:hypothetical protein LUZ60_001357 [Juncus effusus]